MRAMKSPWRLEVVLYRLIRATRPLDWFVRFLGFWLSEVMEFDVMTLDIFITMANTGDVYPRSRWGDHVHVPVSESGPLWRRVYYKALLIVVGFPITLAMSAKSAFMRPRWPGLNGRFIDLLILWGWRGAFRGVYLAPSGIDNRVPDFEARFGARREP